MRQRSRVVWLRVLAMALGLASACAPSTERGRTSSGGEAMAAPRTQSSAQPGPDMVRELAPLIGRVADDLAHEPQLLTPLVLTPGPAEPTSVRVAHLGLDPHQAFRPPTGPCQDMLLFLRHGELRAVGTGIAHHEAPATLYPGDAVRFGPEGDGLVQNLGERRARSVVVFVRRQGEPSFVDPGSSEGCPLEPPRDPRVLPLRFASLRTVDATPTLGGALRVRAMLGAEGERVGSLSALEGEPDLVVPEHRHDDAVEVWIVEDGAGVMRIGDRAVEVRPGAGVFIPRGALHGFRSDGSRPLRAIQVLSER